MLHSVTSQKIKGLDNVPTEARNRALGMQRIRIELKGNKNGWIAVSVALWTQITNELIFAFVIFIKWHILACDVSYLHVLMIILFF
jgi:hypothetical protein